MKKKELIDELLKNGLTLESFLKHYKYDINKLRNHSSNKKISERMELECKLLICEINNNKNIEKINKIEEQKKELVNNLYIFETKENDFIPVKGQWYCFWNTNSEVLVIGKYDYTGIHNRNKFHYVQGKFKKGYQFIKEIEKESIPKDFFKVFYTR